MDSMTGGGSPRRTTFRRTGRAGVFLLAAVAFVLARWAGPASATECAGATITWDGGAGTTAWGTAQNWTGDVLPGAADRACIPASAGVTVVHSTGTTSVASLEVTNGLTLSGGTLSVTDTGASSSVGTLTVSGATLGGTGTVDVTGALTWTAGRMSGTGTTHVTSAATLSIANTNAFLYLDPGRTLANDGTASLTASNGYSLNAYQDVVIRNAGVWTVSGSFSTAINNVGTGTAPVFRNESGGIVRRTSGNVALTLGVRVANDGLIEANAGSISLTGGDDGSAHSGTFGTAVSFGAGTYSLSGATLSGATIAGATVNATGPVSVPTGTTTLSSGVLGGGGTVEVAGAFTWSGGRMSGTGTTHVASGATMTISNGGSHLYLDPGRALSNDGTVTWAPSGGYTIYAYQDVVVSNAGLWTVSGTNGTGMSDQSSSGTKPIFRNLAGAVMRRTSGAQSTTFGVRFANDGLAEALAGSLVFSGGDDGSTHGGTFGTGTSFSSGTYNLSGATLSGVTIAGATVNATGPVSVPVGTTTTMSSGVLGGADTVEVAGAFTWSGGRMSGTGTTHVASGASLTISNTGMHLYLDPGRTLSNDGAVSWAPGGGYSLYAYQDVVVRNAGTWTVSSTNVTGLYDQSSSGTKPVFRNLSGAILRRTSGAWSTTFGVRVANDGLVEALAGSMVFSGGDDGSAHGGTFGAGTSFPAGTFTLDGATLSGTVVNGATVRSAGTVTIPAGTTTAFSSGTLGGAGTFEVAGTLTWTTGHMSDAGTTHIAAGGTLSIANSTSWVYLDQGRTLSNDGTVAWTPGNGYTVYASPGVLIRNAGTWTVTGTVVTGIYLGAGSGQPPVLRNVAGATFRRISGTATTPRAVAVANDGVMDSVTGGSTLSGGDDGATHGGTFGPGVTLSGGTYDLSGATLDGVTVSGATVRASGDVTVAGTTVLSSGFLSGTGTVDVTGTLSWTGGRMTEAGITRVAPGGVLAIANTQHLYLDSGRSLVNEGTVTWSSPNGYTLYAGPATVVRNLGTWQVTGSGPTPLVDNSAGGTQPLVLNTGTVVRSGAGTATFGVPFDNQGTVRVDGGALYLDGRVLNYTSANETLTGGTFVAHGGTLRLGVPHLTTNAAALVVDAASASLVDSTNASLVRDLTRVTTNGDLTLAGVSLTTSARLTNSGRVTVGAGATLTATGGYVQAAGSTVLDAPSAHLTTGAGQTVSVTGGELAGAGTVDVPVSATGGTVSPGTGSTPGTLTVAGSYTAGGGATLLVDVTTAGADQLAAGDVALDGTLHLRTDAGVTAVDGTRYQVVTHAARTGRFAAVAGDPGTGWVYLLEHEPAAVAAVVRPASVQETGGSVVVDGGATYATSRAVTLAVTAPASAVEMRIGNDAAPAGAYQAVTAIVAWDLADLDGARTVYVQFRDATGNQSIPVSDDIVLDRRPAVATFTPPASATGAVVVAFDEAVSGLTTVNVVVRVNGTDLPATLACADAGGATVDCATGLVRTATLRPTAPLAPGVTYTAWVNPAGAVAVVADRAGNVTAAASRTFTIGL